MIPENITKDHILKAIDKIDQEGVPRGRNSTTYNVFYNNKTYPPKLIISYANYFANGDELNPNSYGITTLFKNSQGCQNVVLFH